MRRFMDGTQILRRSGLWPFAADFLAFGSVLSAILTGFTHTTCALAVAAMLVALYRQRGSLKSSLRGVAPTGSYLVVRFLLLAGATAIAEPKVAPVVFWSAVGLLAALISFEPIVRNLSSQVSPHAHNLAGLTDNNEPSFGYGLIYIFNTVALLFVYIAGSSPEWGVVVFAVIVVCAVGLSLFAVVEIFRGIWSSQEQGRGLRDALIDLRPVFAVHWKAPAGTAYQIGMWLPYLDRLGLPYVIIVRTNQNLIEMSQTTDRPIILRRKMEDLDEVIVPSLRAVFYVNTANVNNHMVWFKHLTHVQLNHGESDKAPSFNPVFRLYDKDFVAGQAAIDRFAANGVKMPPDMFTIVGRPQVEDVEVATSHIGTIKEKTVVYAPTWSGFYADSNYSSLLIAPKLVSMLLSRGCRVVFRPHPYAYQSAKFSEACERVKQLLAIDGRKSGREHVFGELAEKEMSIFDCFNEADAMISDVSSVVGDFLHSEKPLAMVAVSVPASRFNEIFPMSRAAYVFDAHAGRLSDPESVLGELLDADPMESHRKELKTYYLGDIPDENYAQRFVDEALAVIDARDPGQIVSSPS